MWLEEGGIECLGGPHTLPPIYECIQTILSVSDWGAAFPTLCTCSSLFLLLVHSPETLQSPIVCSLGETNRSPVSHHWLLRVSNALPDGTFLLCSIVWSLLCTLLYEFSALFSMNSRHSSILCSMLSALPWINSLHSSILYGMLTSLHSSVFVIYGKWSLLCTFLYKVICSPLCTLLYYIL